MSIFTGSIYTKHKLTRRSLLLSTRLTDFRKLQVTTP